MSLTFFYIKNKKLFRVNALKKIILANKNTLVCIKIKCVI